MSRTLRFALGLCLLLGLLLPLSNVSGAAVSLTPPPAWYEPSPFPSNCTKGLDANKSEMLFCKPSAPVGSFFYANLVIFAHGYVNPYFPAKKLPWDQLIFTAPDGSKITSYDMVTKLGYYFASTSYRANGLVVQDAIQDLLLARKWAVSKIGFRLLGVNVILAGVSEGGLITTLSVERYASSYAGGLAMCGPVGDFKGQINYWGDFRTLYDAFYNPFTPSYGGSAISIPDKLITSWYSRLEPATLSALKTQVLAQAALDPAKTMRLLDATTAPYVAADPTSMAATISGLLDYNIFATNNGQSVLGGNPYGNATTSYSVLSSDLVAPIQRYTASASALTNLAKYETTGKLSKPLVLLHNQGDPIVPYWHTSKYAAKVAAGSKFSVQTAAAYYGHCNFSESDIMTAFNQLGSYVSGATLAAAQKLPADQREALMKQMRDEGTLK